MQPQVGKPLLVEIPCAGLAPGSPVVVKVFEPHAVGGDPVETLQAKVAEEGGVARVRWTYDHEKHKAKVSRAAFVLVVEGGGRVSASPLIEFVAPFEATVKDPSGAPAARHRAFLHADRGPTIEAATDEHGKIVALVPPGVYHVELGGPLPKGGGRGGEGGDGGGDLAGGGRGGAGGDGEELATSEGTGGTRVDAGDAASGLGIDDDQEASFARPDGGGPAPVPPPPPPAAECREVGGPHFDFDRSFVRPEGVKALKDVFALLEDRAKRALVYGHTDTVGDETYNKKLSERRARAVLAVLTHDATAWESLAKEESWGLPATQAMLNAVLEPPDLPEPLVADGAMGPKTREAVKAFQKKSGLNPDGDPGPKTREALTLAYMKKASEKPAGRDRFKTFGNERFMGCGEYNPFTEGRADEASRRVVVLVHDPGADPGELPCAIGDTAPCKQNLLQSGEKPPPRSDGAADPTPHFRCKVFRRIATLCPCGTGAAVASFRVQLHDERYRPCANVEYRLTLESGSVRTGKTDEKGWLRTAVPQDKPRVTIAYVPANEKVELSVAVELRSSDGGKTDAYYLAQIKALGFEDSSDEGTLLRFQGDRDLELTGVVDAPTKKAIDDLLAGGDDSLEKNLGGDA